MEYHDKYFTKDEIIERFKVFEGDKTFGEIDVRDVFHQQVPAKGILGCVIEQSILEMKQNSAQEADLEIIQKDGTYKSTELKVTGVEQSSKKEYKYEAKEPLSLTAVSIGTIEKETFLESHFYNKIAHMLWIFYIYNRKEGQKTVPYAEYKGFPILGYMFLDIADDKDELARFENDWLQAQKFLIKAGETENPEERYPLLHQSIKDKLFYVDIAPRFKLNPKQTPRFRFKKSYVNAIFQQFYEEKKHKKSKLEKLPDSYNSYSEIEQKLHSLTEQYKGKTVEELIGIFEIQVKDITKLPKSVTEVIFVNMFGGKSKKISNIEVFKKIGVIAKTITVTTKNSRTEDMKLFTMDLDEITNPNLEYEETSYYEYFSNHQMLCIVFEEPSIESNLNDNKFLGFKRLIFDENLLNGTIKDVYNVVCDRINNNTLVESYEYKEDGTQKINKTGVPKVSLNFPKSSEYEIFVRGTSSDSTYKPWTFKGQAADGRDIIHTYSQQIWIKGSYITNILKDIDFI